MAQKKNKSTVEIRDDILSKALPNVIFDGWSMDMINQAAQDCGYDDLTVRAAFPDGITDVLDAFADMADRAMLAALADVNADDLKVRDRVRTALIARFTYLNTYKDAVKESLKYWLHPLRKPRAAKITWRSADRIWDFAGDTATDYNRYTKRGLLSGIIASSTLVWLNDSSDDMDKTIRFIDGRIENVMQLGKIIGRLKA
jgi:ubiquinone biosynthesis protein COQ9